MTVDIRSLLSDMAPHAVSAQKGSWDHRGTWSNSADPPVVVPCLVSGGTFRILSEGGQEQISKLKCVTLSGNSLNESDYSFTVPAEFGGRTYRARKVEKFSDDDGNSHEVIYLP